MQKWEYLTINAGYVNSAWRVVVVNDDNVANPEKGVSLPKYLDELGNQGWELVSEITHTFGSLFEKVDHSPVSRDVDKITSIAENFSKNGYHIESVIGFSGGAIGEWLIYGRRRIRVLRFKRQKP
jgi:hypothetical protein